MLFCNLLALVLGSDSVKYLRVKEFLKKDKFEVIWGELQAQNCLQRLPLTKYMKQTLVFM